MKKEFKLRSFSDKRMLSNGIDICEIKNLNDKKNFIKYLNDHSNSKRFRTTCWRVIQFCYDHESQICDLFVEIQKWDKKNHPKVKVNHLGRNAVADQEFLKKILVCIKQHGYSNKILIDNNDWSQKVIKAVRCILFGGTKTRQTEKCNLKMKSKPKPALESKKLDLQKPDLCFSITVGLQS